MGNLQSLIRAAGVFVSSVVLAALAIAQDGTPIPLELPPESFGSTPLNYFSPRLEPVSFKPRPPFLAPEGVTNVALGKKVTSSDETPALGALAQITDGKKDYKEESLVALDGGAQWVQIDLGAPHEIYAVVVWRYYQSERVYFDFIAQISDDPKFERGVKTLYNNDYDNSSGLGAGEDMEYIETHEGRLVDAKGALARYVRLYSKGNTTDETNHYIEVEVYGRTGTVPADDSRGPYLASGVKVGEVDQDSAIVWARLTANARRNADGPVMKGRPADPLPDGQSVDELEGACPGAPGWVRIRYGVGAEMADSVETPFVEAGAETDYTHQFELEGLRPDTHYHYVVETRAPADERIQTAARGSFGTAPAPDTYRDVTFTVVTGMYYGHGDHPDGFNSYEAMLALEPDFIVPTGDTVYYDSDAPRVTSVAVARYHWQRMYSWPRLVAFQLAVPGYWEKDDHDTYANDCWPGMTREDMGEFTFEQGLAIFREQVPMGEKTYRTYRWGKGLQVWMVEGRDFRSPNDMEDGPDKTIWGAEQIAWLQETLKASDADWKVLISPTPLVGPDRPGKGDNHANQTFAHEGKAMRQWFAENVGENFFIACGDRHWQYHSVDPGTGLHEFSCGPVSDEHASGTPGEDPSMHRFHRVLGGFLSVSTAGEGNSSAIAFRFHDVHGAVVYEKIFKKNVNGGEYRHE